MEYDFAVIGSGFGGSVSALRLAEKGYKVVVLEQGNRVTPLDMEEASRSLFKLLWMPLIGIKGFFTQQFYKHLSIVGGVGVGGGSIVYAAVLLRPKEDFYNDPSWSGLGVNWKKDLKPHYDMASRMLGLKTNPNQDIMDDYLKKTAKKMGALKTFGPVDNGIYFGTPEVTRSDPFFGGLGPARRVPPLRRMPHRVQARVQEHAGQELSLPCGKAGRDGAAEPEGRQHHPPGRRHVRPHRQGSDPEAQTLPRH